MDPLLRLLIPAATGGDDVQMGVVLPMAAMRLDDDDVAAFEGSATDPAEDIIQAPHPTTHERTQHRLSLLIKCFPEELRHGQDDMAVDDSFMEQLAQLGDPGVHIDFLGAATPR